MPCHMTTKSLSLSKTTTTEYNRGPEVMAFLKTATINCVFKIIQK